jgi:hypothetical protein
MQSGHPSLAEQWTNIPGFKGLIYLYSLVTGKRISDYKVLKHSSQTFFVYIDPQKKLSCAFSIASSHKPICHVSRHSRSRPFSPLQYVQQPQGSVSCHSETRLRKLYAGEIFYGLHDGLRASRMFTLFALERTRIQQAVRQQPECIIETRYRCSWFLSDTSSREQTKNDVRK